MFFLIGLVQLEIRKLKSLIEIVIILNQTILHKILQQIFNKKDQRIKMNYLVLFSGDLPIQTGFIRISLQKKNSKKYCNKFTCVQELFLNFNSEQPFVQYMQCSFTQPFASVIILVFISSPIYELQKEIFIENDLHLSACSKQLKQLDLIEFRKYIKKYRYNNYLFSKEIDQILLHPISHSLKLPLFFVTKQQSMDQIDSSQKMFFKYLTVYQKTQTTSTMLQEQIEHLALNRRCLLKYFIDSFQKGQFLFGILFQKFIKNKLLKYKNFIIQTQVQISLDDLLKIVAKQQIKSKKDKIKLWKKSISKTAILFRQTIKVINYSPFSQLNKNKDFNTLKSQIQYPLIFYEKFFINHQILKPNSSQYIQGQTKQLKDISIKEVQNLLKNKKKRKIFIFAHGFQGLPSDMFYLMNQVKKKYPKAKYIVLKGYRTKMEGNIQEMAQIISLEITQFLQGINSKEVQYEITMIGHSMGSIILRSALRHLSKYKDCFFCFISLCSPHLGYIQGTNFLTQTGLSLLSKIKPIQSLLQVSNRDHSKLQETFIFHLSKAGNLSDFEQILLVSSIQDNYVPWHSARIEPYNEQKGKGWIQRQMIANILGLDKQCNKIKKISRVDVHFQNSNKSFTQLDSWIGRISHIKPLIDQKFIQMLVQKFI